MTTRCIKNSVFMINKPPQFNTFHTLADMSIQSSLIAVVQYCDILSPCMSHSGNDGISCAYCQGDKVCHES